MGREGVSVLMADSLKAVNGRCVSAGRQPRADLKNQDTAGSHRLMVRAPGSVGGRPQENRMKQSRSTSLFNVPTHPHPLEVYIFVFLDYRVPPRIPHRNWPCSLGNSGSRHPRTPTPLRHMHTFGLLAHSRQGHGGEASDGPLPSEVCVPSFHGGWPIRPTALDP